MSATCGGIMTEFTTGAVREDKTGKGRCDLLPMCALIRLSKHYEKGSADHGERNWEKGIPMHSFLDSAIRHLFKYMDGQTDEDHLCAAAWNILGAMWTEEKRPEMQDIPSRASGGPPSLQKNIPGTDIPDEKMTQEEAKKSQEKKCKYYHILGNVPRCYGTREDDPCNFDGDKRLCDLYHYKMNKTNELQG